MQLDQTRIAIRQRSFIEVLDLAIVVVREFWKPILGWAFVGILPFAILNWYVLSPQVDYEQLLMIGSYDTTENLLRFRHLVNSVTLVFLEAPLALLPVTYYLGQAVFTERPLRSQVIAALKSTAWTSLLFLGLFRCGLVGAILMGCVGRETTYSYSLELLGLIICCGSLAFFSRCGRPFAPEIIVLENCSIGSGKNKGVSYGQRSRWLHSQLTSELVTRMLGATLFVAFGWYALFFSLVWLRWVITTEWGWGLIGDLVFMPVSLWSIAVYTTVVRFLNYLDARIRLEGWEVELKFRAELRQLEVQS